jgi:quercetin dioxygenase-like cupin family protein
MTRIGTHIGLSLGFALAALLPLSAMAEDAHTVVQANGVKWAAAPPSLPKGAQIAVLYGDPSKEGSFVYRLKFPAGYKVPPHMHPNDENVTVISGTVHIGTGDKLDPKKGEAVKPGGYFHMPKGMHHFGWVTEETVLQLNGVGPIGVTYINPADDPRKTN